ncbi:MAG: TlpA family protein disulfide reductase [Sphingobacteriaceae bacterium]|nr:TlpA family protein disulfide reductase [Sphingobacteriaceae bacterium]
MYVFLEEKPIEVALDSLNYYKKSTLSGSVNQQIFDNYRKNKNIKIDSFIRENSNTLAAAYILYRDWSYRLNPEQIQENINLLDSALHRSNYVQTLKQLIPILKKVQKGNKAIDLALPDAENKIKKLSSQYGKYILVDFWASWCPPCRAENPNVVKVFEKYKHKNFTVFGVSLDKNKENWLKAIKDDQLNWTQVSDLNFWNSEGAKTYGVRAIPANVLIDPNGIIVARNLYGDELEKKIAELLN